MAVAPPVPIPFPTSTFPGNNPQESSGRLINCYADPISDQPAQNNYCYRRAPGLSLLAIMGSSSYRGGLTVHGVAYECLDNIAWKVHAGGSLTEIGTFPGERPLAGIAQNQAEIPDVVAVDPDNGAYVLASASVIDATGTITVSASGTLGNVLTLSGSVAANDVVNLKFTNPALGSKFPLTLTYTALDTDTLQTIAQNLTYLILVNADLQAVGFTATTTGQTITVTENNPHASATVLSYTVSPGSETITFNPSSGSLVNYVPGDAIALIFQNPQMPDLINTTVSATYVVKTGDGAALIATGLAAAVNANNTLFADGISASSSGPTITVSQPGFLGNQTTVIGQGPANLTVLFTYNGTTQIPQQLSGGQGTPDAFTGIPTFYNGFGVMPVANSVCFQDSYFFFTVSTGQVFATVQNGLTINALTYVTVQAKADVILLRGVAFQGVLLLFTTGSCEVWQDSANPAPNFPYSRVQVLEFGLIQYSAIAGWDTGFSQLLWVAQDFGVYWLQSGTLTPQKVSPPDLDRMIEMDVRNGVQLEAGCYIFSGKKVWHISGSNWTWEFNLSTAKWNERWSLNGGVYGAWRGRLGHPAFGRWIVGDRYGDHLFVVDDQNYSENGNVLLSRIESGPVANFPSRTRVARADFLMNFGAGLLTRAYEMAIIGAAANSAGGIRLTVNSASMALSGDTVNISGVGGTTEANGTWIITAVDETHIDLNGSRFVHAYTSGGLAIDVTQPPNAITPVCSISMSRDGGLNWGNPLIRQIGRQGIAKDFRVSVKSMGLSWQQGVRWRIDITDPVQAVFFGGTQSSDPRAVGT